MSKIEKILIKMRNSPKNINFSELVQVCEYFFGQARQKGTSHCVYKMPWLGDPRVNIQRGSNGKAKFYQVKQVLLAIEKLEGQQHEQQ